jgi:hypothetical protein
VRSTWLWGIALLITLAAAWWQRVSGPTYPLDGRATMGASTFRYRLERTHAGPGDARVAIPVRNTEVQGELDWKLLGSAEWNAEPMSPDGVHLVGRIPHQPSGTKVAYRVRLILTGQTTELPPGAPAVLRFRGDVPWWVLIPHILAMFAAMLYSTRAGLETLRPNPRLAGLAHRTIAALSVGGIVLGCVVAWYAFRVPWGGFPLSNDPTDNKTLLALVAWIVAAVMLRWGRRPRAWVAIASLVTLLVFGIPHSIAPG